MNSPAKLVGKTGKPSPLLEMFSTNLEKLLFPCYSGVTGVTSPSELLPLAFNESAFRLLTRKSSLGIAFREPFVWGMR